MTHNRKWRHVVQCVIVAMIHTFGSPIEFRAFEVVLTILMPAVVAAFLIWYAKRAGTKGWVS